jgi:L-rhamnose mutarotase
MSVNAGAAKEYELRHRPIWNDLEEALLGHGVATYSIFLDPESRDLFGYVEVESADEWDRIGTTDVCRRWWRHMRDLMPTNGDDSPRSRDLREVFHIGRSSPSRPGDAESDRAGAGPNPVPEDSR